jgi:hypothetical protein
MLFISWLDIFSNYLFTWSQDIENRTFGFLVRYLLFIYLVRYFFIRFDIQEIHVNHTLLLQLIIFLYNIWGFNKGVSYKIGLKITDCDILTVNRYDSKGTPIESILLSYDTYRAIGLRIDLDFCIKFQHYCYISVFVLVKSNKIVFNSEKLWSFAFSIKMIEKEILK